MKNIWKHKKFKGPYLGFYRWSGKKRLFVLESDRIGIVDYEWFESWQDAKAAGWVKVK